MSGTDERRNGKAIESANGHGPPKPASVVNGSSNGTAVRAARPSPAKPVSATGLRNSRAGAGTLRYAHIVGWGKEIPAKVITNSDLVGVIETSDEWIRARTGIQARRFANDKETVTTLGFEAARRALDRAGVLPSELDLIVVATSTPENFYPSTGSQIQDLLGATHAGAFDLSAACSGFVYALNMAAQSIRTGSINTALVIGSETNSRVMDWSDRATCILFGDGAGAIVLQGSDEPGGILSCVLGSDGSGAELLGIPTVGSPVLTEGRLLHKLHMDGHEVFRFATRVISQSIREALDKAGLDMADVSLIVPHQANQRIIAAAARSLNIPETMFYSNIHKYGNTSAASIPIALCEAEEDGRIKPNDRIAFVGFGGGLSWGAMVVQWQGVQPRVKPGLPMQILRGRREAEIVLAFWRGRVMRVYRRLEAWVRGPTVRQAHIRTRRRKSVASKPSTAKMPVAPKPAKSSKTDSPAPR